VQLDCLEQAVQRDYPAQLAFRASLVYLVMLAVLVRWVSQAHKV
jgi:hypothetical protein